MPRLSDISNAVYFGAIKECEHREYHEPRITGSGQHMAQHIATAVEARLVEVGTSNLPLLLLAVRKAALEELQGRELSPDTDSHALLTNRSATAIVENVKAELLERQLFTDEHKATAHAVTTPSQRCSEAFDQILIQLSGPELELNQPARAALVEVGLILRPDWKYPEAPDAPELPTPERLREDFQRKIWPSIVTFVVVTAGGATALTLGVSQYIVLPLVLGSAVTTYIVLARRR